MPLEQRVIAPIWVSRGCFELNQHHPHYLQGSNQQINVANELECVTNGTLSNIIRQLSSLSRHAEDLFGSLLHETSGLVQRSVNLKQRLDILTEKVERLSDAGPDQPVGTIGKKPFKSKADNFDQEIVARSTIPVSLREVYERCDPPPCLSKLNQFRDDNLDGLQLYTNPNYFFELWKNDMLAGKGKSSKKDSHSSSAKKSKSRNSSSRHQSIDAGKALPPNVHYHVQAQQQQQHSPHPQNSMIMNQGPNSRTSLASGDMPYGAYNDNNSVLQQQQQAYAQQQQQKIYGQVPAQGPNQPIYGYQGQAPPGTYEQGYENSVYNQQHVQQNRPNSLELTQQQQYYQRLEYYNQQQQYSGVYLNNPQALQQQQQVYVQNNQYQNQQGSPMGTPTKRAPGVSRPSVAPPAPPPGASGSQPTTPVKGRMMNGNMSDGNVRDSLPPPPPPPPMMDEMPPPPPPQVGNSGGAPPPPPPPPMPTADTGFAPPPPPPPPPPAQANIVQNRSMEAPKKPAVSNSLAKPTAEMLQSVKLKKTEPKTNNGGNDDERSNLLAAIRQGIKLKRVEETRKEVEKTAPLHDVASILARRVAMQMSDSEGEGKNNDSEESDGWDDDSEC